MKNKGPYIEIYPGIFSCYPLTREEALKEKIAFYHPTPCLEPCERPGHEPDSLRYTITGIAKCCAIRDALHAYKIATSKGEPTSAAAGKGYYWISKPNKCGHVGKVLDNGKCAICATIKKPVGNLTPRQLAIENGQKWYMPTTPCPRCGKIAWRYAANGKCATCDQKTGPPIYLTAPDLIISRKDAKALDLRFYRTGKKCRKCGNEWRYAANGLCIGC